MQFLIRRSTSSAAAVSKDACTFFNCHIRPSLITSLQTNFTITHPTPLQFNFLSVLNTSCTKDIILHLPTGFGKSLALVVGLLNLNKPPTLQMRNTAITPSHLIIVPHSDLGKQLYSWISNLIPEHLVPNTVQLVSAHDTKTTCDTPHILIGTPKALLHLAQNDLLDPSGIGTIALDEVDLLTPPIPKFNSAKANVRQIHIKPIESLMALLISLRAGPSNAHVLDPVTRNPHLLATKSESSHISAAQYQTWLQYKPRMVAISATASSSVRHHLVSQLKWIHPKRYAYLMNDVTKHTPASLAGEPTVPVNVNDTQSNKNDTVMMNIRHSAVIVTPSDSLCLQSYYRPPPIKKPGPLDHLGVTDTPKPKPTAHTLGVPTTLHMLSTMVAYARVQCITHALVVVLGNKSVTDTVQLLNNHRSVDASVWCPEPPPAAHDPNSVMLQVISAHGIRGLDIHNLSHIFLLGVPGHASLYQHISGRIGRLGHANNTASHDGSVVCFCDGNSSHQLKVIWNWLSTPNTANQFKPLHVVPVAQSVLARMRNHD